MRLQRTLRQEVAFSGTGLHTGRPAAVKLRPAPRDTGIVFYRLDKMAVIRANARAVTDTAYATSIGNGNTKIRTVEHLLAALAGIGIDNVIIEITGPEIPIMDGSSTELVGIILKAGIAKQGKKMPYLKINKPIVMHDDYSEIAVFPYEGRKITFSIHFKHHFLGEQNFSIDLSEETFIKDIAPARTFGFLKDIQRMTEQGLAKGGSLDNAIILGDKGVLNSSGLRYENEFVRHKILDCIGDLSLIGFPIYGHIMARKAGHSTNIKFVNKIISSSDHWEIITESGQAQHALAC